MRVGQALSALLDPSKPPMFGEDPQLQQLTGGAEASPACGATSSAAAGRPRLLLHRCVGLDGVGGCAHCSFVCVLCRAVLCSKLPSGTAIRRPGFFGYTCYVRMTSPAAIAVRMIHSGQTPKMG